MSGSVNMEDRWLPMKAVYGEELFARVRASRLLVIGAGGIGCELLKDLVLAGFQDIEVVDLDTIDVSNLNRQFLFQKQHVGMSKAQVAREAVLKYNPEAKIIAHHANVMTPEYGPSYVGKFNLVLNALDNLPARRHVNRVCLAAGVPLIESGTQGWLGQVQPFVPPHTSCFDCEEHPTPTTFAVCTIRSKPSKPIHCIHWAKLLFARLFGKPDNGNNVVDLDRDEDDAPGDDADQSKTKTVDEALQKVLEKEQEVLATLRNKERFHEYAFHKLYHTDTLQLASMKHMWEDRAPPVPFVLDVVREGGLKAIGVEDHTESTEGLLEDQRVWTMQECVKKFEHSVKELSRLKNEKAGLDWDKDEDLHLDFVVAASNLRCSQFGIPRQSRFTVKSAAGNIIPAIATTNAIISGLIVSEALKIIRGGDYLAQLKATYLQKVPSRKRMLLLASPEPPKPTCFVCGSNFVQVAVDTDAMTVGIFASEILEKKLNIAVPSIMIDSNIIFEGGEMLEDFEHQIPKKLTQVGMRHGAIVRVTDMGSGTSFSVDISIIHKSESDFKKETPHPFELTGSVRNAPAPADEEKPAETAAEATNGNDDDDFLVIVEAPKNSDAAEAPSSTSAEASRKRKREDGGDATHSANGNSDDIQESASKRQKVVDLNDDVMVIDD